MFGPISIQRLSLVYPTLRDLIMQLETQLSEPIGVSQGLRSYPEQEALYAQGRLTLQKVNALRKAVHWAPMTKAQNIDKVTDAQPGYSWHNFGMAVDVVPFESSGQPDWDEQHPVWQEIVAKGTALGLVAGVAWNDRPHFQLTGKFPETPTDEVRATYTVEGIDGVWRAANENV
jgi:hypothetical protein